MKSYFLFSLLMIICVWMSCSKPHTKPGKTDDGHCGITEYPYYDCDTIACTMVVAALDLTILDKNNKPVVLDSFYTENNSGKMPSSLYSRIANGNYIIFNDSWVAGHKQTHENVKFKG